RVAAHLDIPFLTFDFSDVYKKEVADYMISEYKAGRTPNPDVMCNKEIKFGAFLDKAISMGADYVATGHYADNKDLKLLKNKDISKDQSYFLWTLKQGQLRKILFPIGHLKKTQVRVLAKKFGLPVAEKKDSQGICFLGAVDLKDFLKHYIKEKKGKVLNTEGKEIGYHSGVVFHTLGERHGFTITKKSPNDGAYYVVGKDIKKNILYVAQKNSKQSFFRHTHDYSGQSLSGSSASREKTAVLNFSINLKDINWISEIPKKDKNYTAQIRYHGEFLPCKINILNKKEAEIIFDRPVLVDAGQSCVIYDGDVCMGGGVIV
ncbi:MAG: tRNA 2-thiouridine(34) synthase MnmA, partial [Patescibacteria group bacterium]